MPTLYGLAGDQRAPPPDDPLDELPVPRPDPDEPEEPLPGTVLPLLLPLLPLPVGDPSVSLGERLRPSTEGESEPASGETGPLAPGNGLTALSRLPEEGVPLLVAPGTLGVDELLPPGVVVTPGATMTPGADVVPEVLD